MGSNVRQFTKSVYLTTPADLSLRTTDWMVVVSVLSMFILLTKTTMYITHAFPPLLSTLVHGCLTIVWAMGIHNQAASDYSDPEHPSKVPWYLTQSCGAPVTPSLRGYCGQAKASFAFSVLMW